MPEWRRRNIIMEVEFIVDGSVSNGAAVDLAMSTIESIDEVVVEDSGNAAHVYLRSPTVRTISVTGRLLRL